MVLADRRLDIVDSIAYRGATLSIPAFPKEVEATHKIANVCIHVERVIGAVHQRLFISKDMDGW